MSSLLTFQDVSFSYHHSKEALKNISFSMREGEKVALLGLNGSGKSTLMLHTNGLLTPTSGEVAVKGISTKSKSLKEIRRTVGIVFQNPDDQLFMPTVWDDIAFGPENMNLTKEEIDQRVYDALNNTNTLELKDLSPFQLSGGQKKNVAIATVLSMMPELLVMDEPTSGLDYMATKNILQILKKIPHAILISTHDIEFAMNLCNRAILLVNGELKYDGDISNITYPPSY